MGLLVGSAESFDFCLEEFFLIPESWSGRRNLQVKKLEETEYSGVKKTIHAWEQKASEKVGLSKDEGQITQFSNCLNILYLMGLALSRKQPLCEIFSCSDDQGNLQGLMKIENPPGQDVLKIINLVTHPQNIRSPLNRTENGRVTGAGTALVKKAEEVARKEKKDVIRLRSFESVLDFYKKCGFQIEDDKFLEMSKPVEREKNNEPS